MLKPALPSYTIYSISLPPSHPWHFMGFLPPGFTRFCDTCISSYIVNVIGGAFASNVMACLLYFLKIKHAEDITPESLALFTVMEPPIGMFVMLLINPTIKTEL